MKSFGIFSSSKVEEKERIAVGEVQKDEGILDTNVISYIISEFPAIATDLREALNNLINTIDKGIDYIEDKSNEVVKKNRDYEIGGKYRDTSIKLYDINKELNDYIKWMEDGLSRNIQEDGVGDIKTDERKVELNVESALNEEAKDLDLSENHLNNKFTKKVIYEDFTLNEPCKLKIDEYEQTVEGWDDMIVKTADLLTKKYKHNKILNMNNSNVKIKIVRKKSKENESRDIIIEMLNDHKIDLNSFNVFIKKEM